MKAAMRAWRDAPPAAAEISIGEGLLLVLSRFEGERAEFEHEEAEDVVGLGFHLKGGASFRMGQASFETRPYEIWAGAAPRSALSTFSLPASGFETVSLRMRPGLARSGALASHRLPASLSAMGSSAETAISSARVGSLALPAAMIVRSMLSASAACIGTPLFHESCVYALLELIEEEEGGVHSTSVHRLARSKLDHARELLQQHHTSPPTISALARAVGTNEFTLKRAFKDAFGITIYGHVRRYRMEQAAVRLDQGATVQDAAAAVGYNCPRAFADAFRRSFGVLPSAMARRHHRIAPARHG